MVQKNELETDQNYYETSTNPKDPVPEVSKPQIGESQEDEIISGSATAAPENRETAIQIMKHLTAPDYREELKGRLEAVLFAAGEPVSVREMAELLEVVPDAVETVLAEMADEYSRPGRGIQVIRLHDRIQLATKTAYSSWVLKLAQVNERQTLSKGALECLAIVAYKQPVTRIEVDEIRGVSSDYVMNKLIDRGFISVIGKKNVPGRPKLYATTEEFLRQFGFSDLKHFTEDPTYRELMKSVELPGENQGEEVILEDTEEEDDTQLSIWNRNLS